MYAVETCSRSAGSAAQSPKKATSAPPKATKVVSVEIQPAVRREMRAAGERDRERSGERREQADPGAGDHQPRQRARLVDVEGHAAPGHRDDEPEPDRDLGRGDGHHREREDLAVEVTLLARERDQGEVRRVQHDLEREEDDQRAAPEHHPERADPEQHRRDDQVPADAGAVHLARVFLLARRAEDDAADGGDEQHDRGDLEREQVVGEEELADLGRAAEGVGDLGRVLRLSPHASPSTTTTSTSSAAAATTAAVRRSGGPPAHGASARPPRYATTKRNMTMTAPA